MVTTTSLTVSGKCEASETKKGRGLSRPAGSLREYHANSANDAESRSSSCSFFCDNFQSPRCFTTADSPLLPPEVRFKVFSCFCSLGSNIFLRRRKVLS